MKFGILVPSLNDVDLVVRAEELGYQFCWAPDSQMLFENPFVVLALAAQRTHKIKLGTGLAVAGLRLAPALANSIATVAQLAPGRVFAGIATGNTAMRTIGQRPMQIARFREYLRVVRGLLDGDEVEYTLNGKTSLIRFQSKALRPGEHGPVPIHVGAIGPKAQMLAGEFGDAIVTSFPRGGTITDVRKRAAAGAGDRDLAGFEVYALMNLLLLEPGESLTSERAIRECGPAIMANVHYLVDLHRETQMEPPEYVQPIWDDYLAYHAARDQSRSHQQLHQSHYAYLQPGEEKFITPEIIRNFCLAGQPSEIIQRLHELEAEGLDGVNFAFPADATPALIEKFGSQVVAHYDR